MGYRAILADADTRIVAGGDDSFEQARAVALRYLGERIARRHDANPQRLANLRLTLLRLSQASAPTNRQPD